MSTSSRGRQRVDHRHADAVQATTDRVAASSPPNLPPACSWVITTSTVGTPGGVHGDRDATAVVGDLDAAVLEHHDIDGARVTGHRLVDRVVDHLPDEVVQTALAGGADVHAGPFADGFQTLENR